MMMCSCRSKSKVVFLEVSRYEGQLPRVDGVEVGLPGWLPATARRPVDTSGSPYNPWAGLLVSYRPLDGTH